MQIGRNEKMSEVVFSNTSETGVCVQYGFWSFSDFGVFLRNEQNSLTLQNLPCDVLNGKPDF